MKGYVYFLLSKKDKKSYLGSTTNLERRLLEHRLGKCQSTKYRLPLELIHYEVYEDIAIARKRESFLKTKSGRKELKEIFKTLPGSQAVRQ